MPARHCLVTGANRGLGLEFTRQLLARGDRVLAAARDPDRADALHALGADAGGRLAVRALDVADDDAHAGFATAIDTPLDLVVHNAGVLVAGERFGDVRAADLERSLRVNAIGPFLLTQALAPRLAAGARIVAIGSGLGSIGEAGNFGTPSYRISKAALNMATVQLAHALRDRGIVVAAFCPGWVRTDMGGAGARLAPEDSVGALLSAIDALTADRSGRFLDRFGADKPW